VLGGGFVLLGLVGGLACIIILLVLGGGFVSLGFLGGLACIVIGFGIQICLESGVGGGGVPFVIRVPVVIVIISATEGLNFVGNFASSSGEPLGSLASNSLDFLELELVLEHAVALRVAGERVIGPLNASGELADLALDTAEIVNEVVIAADASGELADFATDFPELVNEVVIAADTCAELANTSSGFDELVDKVVVLDLSFLHGGLLSGSLGLGSLSLLLDGSEKGEVVSEIVVIRVVVELVGTTGLDPLGAATAGVGTVLRSVGVGLQVVHEVV